MADLVQTQQTLDLGSKPVDIQIEGLSAQAIREVNEAGRCLQAKGFDDITLQLHTGDNASLVDLSFHQPAGPNGQPESWGGVHEIVRTTPDAAAIAAARRIKQDLCPSKGELA